MFHKVVPNIFINRFTKKCDQQRSIGTSVPADPGTLVRLV